MSETTIRDIADELKKNNRDPRAGTFIPPCGSARYSGNAPRSQGVEDGAMYNPFAEAFRKAREKK